MKKNYLCCCPDIGNVSEDGRVVFMNGSDYIFEKNGTFKFTKNVKIEKGAKLKVIDSNVTY